MPHYALVLLLIGLAVGVLNFAGLSTLAVKIFWILFLIGMSLAVMHVVNARRNGVT